MLTYCPNCTHLLEDENGLTYCEEMAVLKKLWHGRGICPKYDPIPTPQS